MVFVDVCGGTFYGICDVFEHGEVDDAVLVVPINRDLGSLSLSNLGKWCIAISAQL